MLTFTVLVEASTNDALKDGELVTTFSTVQVMADDEHEAVVVAAQMVACRGVVPTAATIDWSRF